jgi:cyclic pyranopterin phosphate synthase
VDAIGYPAILFDAEKLRVRMGEAARLGVKSVMFAGTGEPLVHKRISAITRSAVESGLDVAFTTNGTLLHKLDCVDQCSWIKVSLNAGRKESYAAIHKTDEKDWDTVWENITAAVKRKGKCTIGVQCVVLPENVYEMRELASLCIDAGVDYLVLKPYSQGTFSITKQYEGTDYAAMRAYLRGREGLRYQELQGHLSLECDAAGDRAASTIRQVQRDALLLVLRHGRWPDVHLLGAPT